eukprot:3450573-Rhodomonas_salina.1
MKAVWSSVVALAPPARRGARVVNETVLGCRFWAELARGTGHASILLASSGISSRRAGGASSLTKHRESARVAVALVTLDVQVGGPRSTAFLARRALGAASFTKLRVPASGTKVVVVGLLRGTLVGAVVASVAVRTGLGPRVRVLPGSADRAAGRGLQRGIPGRTVFNSAPSGSLIGAARACGARGAASLVCDREIASSAIAGVPLHFRGSGAGFGAVLPSGAS